MGSNNKKIRRPFRYYLQNILVISAIVLILGYAYYRNIADIISLRAEVKSLETQIQSAQEESSRLDDDLAQIGTQSYIEKIARKYLGLYYPNEKIIVPVEKKTTETATDTTTETTTDGTADTTETTETVTTDTATG